MLVVLTTVAELTVLLVRLAVVELGRFWLCATILKLTAFVPTAALVCGSSRGLCSSRCSGGSGSVAGIGSTSTVFGRITVAVRSTISELAIFLFRTTILKCTSFVFATTHEVLGSSTFSGSGGTLLFRVGSRAGALGSSSVLEAEIREVSAWIRRTDFIM